MGSVEDDTFTRASLAVDSRTVIIDSYAFSMTVRRGALVIKASGHERVITRYDCRKTSDGIARVIILSNAGNVSIEAMRWCAALDVAVYHVGRDGNQAFAAPGMVPSDARLFRRQVLAQDGMPDAALGISLTRELLTAKITGQHEVMKTELGAGFERIGDYTEMLSRARTLTELLAVEGNASRYYWKAWESRVFVPVKSSDRKVLPAHWQTFNGRATQTRAGGYSARSNRNAVDFVNACLNYAYKVAETEAAYACYCLGLHPALGLAHGMNDKDSPGMALDILEPLRPVADKVVLSFLDHGKGMPVDENGNPAWITRECAYELDNGVCRLFPPMTSRLASAVSMAVAPHALTYAESVATALTHTHHISVTAPFDPRLRERQPRYEIGPEVTAEDIVSDALWAAIEPLIPAFVKGNRYQADTRRVLAGVILHEVYGVAWGPKIDAKRFANWQTCRKRLDHWKAAGAWSPMLAEITRPGVSLSESAVS